MEIFAGSKPPFFKAGKYPLSLNAGSKIIFGLTKEHLESILIKNQNQQTSVAKEVKNILIEHYQRYGVPFLPMPNLVLRRLLLEDSKNT